MQIAEFYDGQFKRFRVVSALGRFGHESFQLWVVSAGSFRPGSFRPDFRVGRFGPIYPQPPICYNINEFSFMISHTIYSLCSAAVSKESYTQLKEDDDTYHTQAHTNNIQSLSCFRYKVGKRTKL